MTITEYISGIAIMTGSLVGVLGLSFVILRARSHQ
jgi:hypothetical protein